MNQHAAFIRSICENPADDSPRLIYADWLEEQEQVQRAEFIRVQVKLATLPCKMPMGPPGVDVPCYGLCQNCIEAKSLRRREQELLKSPCVPGGKWNRDWWFLPFDEILVRTPRAINHAFRRGFVASIYLHCDDFMRHAKALFERQPIEEVRLVDREPDTTGNLWFCWARGNNMAERGDIPAPLFAFLPRHARLGDQSVVRKTRDESISDLSQGCFAYGRQQAGLSNDFPNHTEEDRVPRGVIYANPPDTPREVLTTRQEELAQAMRRTKRRKK